MCKVYQKPNDQIRLIVDVEGHRLYQIKYALHYHVCCYHH